ncbi:uncharacterized protein LOC132790858 [Drosophila nasuta]|uniref:uncharacterized protein LOC132790858 n=1 Tax=Drosophila nasuta TaxID=42062 RepID=UPI00295F1D44|nr:uncharacterized protein LOC132790858 [Drosophila nasuta]
MVKLLKKVLCLSLRIAGLVIGGLDVVGSVLQSFALGHLTLNLNNFADDLNEFWIPENEDIKEKRRVALLCYIYFAIYSLYIQIKTNNERTEHSEAVYTEVAPIQ